MKKFQRVSPRYPEQDKDILNIASISWLEKRVKAVIKQGKKKRIAKYKNIDPYAFRIEYPSVFFRQKGYFRAAIVSRDNGLCFPDPKIPFISFPDYLTTVQPDATSFPNDAIDITNIDTFETLVSNIGTFPETPRYTLLHYTKEAGAGIALLVESQSDEIDFQDICQRIFKGSTLQEVALTQWEEGDENYPTKRQEMTEYYATGVLTVKDSVFKDRVITLDVFDLRYIKKLIVFHPFLYDGYYRYDGTKVYNGTRTY